MGIKILQNNFTTGVISPQVQARVDLAKYEGACKKIKNAIVMPQGGVTKRFGTKFIAQTNDGILIPFVYSNLQSYVLLFENLQVKIFSVGEYLLFIESEYTLEDLPLLKFVQSADILYLTHPNHPPRMLCRYGHTSWKFKDVQFVPGIQPPSNIYVNETGFEDQSGTYLGTEIEYKIASVSSDGEESLPSEAVVAQTLSTWPQGARVNLNWDSVAGAVRYEIYKNQHGWFEWAGVTENTWFQDDNIEPDSSLSPKEYRDPFHAPATPTVEVTATVGQDHYDMRVSAVNSGGAESAASAVVVGTRVDITPVDGAEQYLVYYKLHATANQNWEYMVADTTGAKDTIEIINPEDTEHPTEVLATYERKIDSVTEGIGYITWKLKVPMIGSHPEYLYTDTGDNLSNYPPALDSVLYWISWNRPGDAHKIVATTYKIKTFTAGGGIYAEPPADNPSYGSPLDKADCYPGAVGIYQQRLMFGGTHVRPQTVWLSETGSYNSMSVSQPIRDDSAITATVDTKQMNEVRHFVSLGDAFVLTNATEFRMQGKDGAITPGTISFRPQSYWGSSHVPPIVVGNTILMIEPSGRVVRDVHYNIQEDGYTGDNRSILAENLLKSPIVDWAYQQNPTNTVYIVRGDGVLVTFTFMREQEIWAWAEHESYNGKYKSVCRVPENGKDRVYFLVERKITDSLSRYFLEEQVIREFGEDSESSCFVDCSYEYSSDTPQSSVSVGLLSGLPVAGVADGSAFYVQNTISGTIELPQPAKHIIVGLPYEMEVVTVDPDIKGQDGTRFGSRKTLGQVTFELLETATLHAGADAAHMEVLKIPTTKQWGEPVVLYSGKFRSPIPGFARNEASIRFTSNDPFPATVLAVRTEVNVE